jgi:hypothetical protein
MGMSMRVIVTMIVVLIVVLIVVMMEGRRHRLQRVLVRHEGDWKP